MRSSSEIIKAASVILSCGHILCPTDTVCGLSADAANFGAVKKVFELKQRSKTKSLIVLVSSFEMLDNYLEAVPPVALNFLEKAEQPITLVYPKGKNLAKNVLAENDSIAIRIVKEGFCHALIEHLNRAIISTSANVSGDPTPSSFAEISETIKQGVDYCVAFNQDDSKHRQASSIYLIEGEELKQIR